MDGFFKVAAASPKVRPADVSGNVEAIKSVMDMARVKGAKLLVLPELCISGYSCGDLFMQKRLVDASRKGLYDLMKASEDKDMLIVAGLPWAFEGALYSVSAVIKDGRLLGIVPKALISGSGDHMESRIFARPETGLADTPEGVPFSRGLIFECEGMSGLSIAVESGAEPEAPVSMTDMLCLKGATIVASCGAVPEVYGESKGRYAMMAERSRRLCCGYVAAFAGSGESTTDFVYGGRRYIAELGDMLATSEAFESGLTIADLDLELISSVRRRDAELFVHSRGLVSHSPAYRSVSAVKFGYREIFAGGLDRSIDPSPFLKGIEDKAGMSREILDIQARALMKRFEHTGARKAVLGLSGGLDSTLVLLALRHAFKLMQRPMEDIICVTMPCFGTTDRTYDNACKLAREIGAELREIRISDSILKHFEDIGHDPKLRNSAYENAQARERTQILMDIANDVNGLDIGTGDLSEEALGWCTFGGDHMANYSVNTSIPKTLIRVIVSEIAKAEDNEQIAMVLRDILDTPVSPELLPSDEQGNIKQKTEDIVGPYELHDFFIYYTVRYGFAPRRVYELACEAFKGAYEKEVIKKWLGNFYRRFFSQQFKRSTALDGPKVSPVDLSPRGGFMMPSDAVLGEWLSELDRL